MQSLAKKVASELYYIMDNILVMTPVQQRKDERMNAN